MVKAGTSFSFDLPADAFVDPQGDPLSWSAGMASWDAAANKYIVSPLPSWITFDANLRRFTVSPSAADVNFYDLALVATDPGSLTDASIFPLVINVTTADVPNKAPARSGPDWNWNPLMMEWGGVATAYEGQEYSYVLPINRWLKDVNGDPLSISVRKWPDQPALPSWLAFDAATNRLYGTPPQGFEGAVYVEIAARDPAGLEGATRSVIDFKNVNDAPEAKAIPMLSAQVGSAINYTVPGNTFTDVDANDSLSLTAKQANGDPLPSWLSFNAATGKFTGTPPTGAHGNVLVTVKATDTAGLAASSSFYVHVQRQGLGVNEAPQLIKTLSVGDQYEDQAWSYSLPADLFKDPNNDALTLTAEQQDPSGNWVGLPSWLSFNGSSFSGTPGNSDTRPYTIRVTARDPGGLSANTQFVLNVLNVNDGPTVNAQLPNQRMAAGSS